MKRPAKTSTKARLGAMIESIPEEARTAAISAALQGMGGSMHVTAVDACPVCGQKAFPAQYRHGIRQCRNCPHYEKEGASPEARNDIIADSRAWMMAHRKAVA